MDFTDGVRGESGFLELPVYVACEGVYSVRDVFRDVEQQAKSGVGFGSPVKVEAMTIEAPCEPRIGSKGGRIGNGLESDSGASERRVNRPETPRPTKVGQAGVDTHAGAGGDEQAVGLT